MTYIQLAWKKSRSEVKIKAFSIYDNWHYNLRVVKKKHACTYFVLIISFINKRSTNAKKYQTGKNIYFYFFEY